MELDYFSQRWRQIQALMDDVFDLPYELQLSTVQQKCHQDPVLCAAVWSLLQAEHLAPAFLEQPAVELAIAPIIKEENKRRVLTNCKGLAGQFIGPYRLCEVIGRGGMGVVFRAKHCLEKVEQPVAIKLLAPEKMSDTSLARFQREQQLLASLSHSGIAQLYETGITAKGQAYFVMEYVAGVPIQQYCDQQCFSIKQRLGLILQIARALSCAHRHQIVHRDIKSDNILVNRQGQVKLLDFGIAKLLKQQGNMDLTRTGDQVMTPGVATPEQLLNQEITVATDIYQLGLLMYEILTGYKAYDQSQSYFDLVKAICEQQPTRPSLMVYENALKSENDAGHKAVIKQSCLRNISARQLAQRLKGDLDAIVLKMLDIKPGQRYSSIDAFAADLSVYFNHRPLVTRNPSPA